jgi:hypothetical protein
VTGDDVLVLAWLLLAHFVADFVLQTDRVVADKYGSGSRAVRGLALHGGAVALCLIPFVLAFALPGLALLLAVTVGHVVIDRWKTVATRAAEARAAAPVPDGAEPDVPEALGPAWTPVPAMLFVLDQAFHVALIGGAWLVLLARAEPTTEWVSVVDAVLRGFPRDQFHLASGALAVVASLLIVNVRAGAFFVATLVRPSERGGSNGVVVEPPPPTPPLPAAWRVRVGPLEAVAEPSRAAAHPSAPASMPVAAHASPLKIGATIGILERLLIVIFVLSGAVAAIGFVVAAKTLARFKQLDDRDFAEYYLLGTLASVSVGLGSALLAQVALVSLAS